MQLVIAKKLHLHPLNLKSKVPRPRRRRKVQEYYHLIVEKREKLKVFGCVWEIIQKGKEKESTQKSALKCQKSIFLIRGSRALSRLLAHFLRLGAPLRCCGLAQQPLYMRQVGYANISNFVIFPPDFDHILKGLLGLRLSLSWCHWKGLDVQFLEH